MLPKVATHILHTTSRAAAAVHNQTSTLRNVLQLQTSPGTSATAGTAPVGPWNGSGSSGWGNHGPGGPGGAKQNAGSRFYAGFTGPVRAVTQANAVASHDGTFVQHEESQDETASALKRRSVLQSPKEPQLRASSASVVPMSIRDHVDNQSVLKTVQIHTRSHRPFAQPPNAIVDAPNSSRTAVSKKTTLPLTQTPTTRRNSTSEVGSLPIVLARTYATTRHSSTSVDPPSIPLPPSPQVTSVDLSSPADPTTTPQSTQPSPHPSQNDRKPSSPRLVQDTTAAHTALKYSHLIQEYGNAGKIHNAEQVFSEYREICKTNPENLASAAPYDRRSVRLVWNQMIAAYFKAGAPEKAVGLVELMMGALPSSSSSTPSSTAVDIPPPASSTFTTVLSGFCESGDVSTALAWFTRLLEQRQAPGEASEDIRPDAAAWNLILESLASRGMVDELNSVFERMLTDGIKDGIAPTGKQRLITFATNMKRIPSLSTAEAERTLVFLVDKVVLGNEDLENRSLMVRRLWEECQSREELKPIASRLGPEFEIQVELPSPTSTLSPGGHTADPSSDASSPTMIDAEEEQVVKPSTSRPYVDKTISRDIENLLRTSATPAEEAYKQLTAAIHLDRLPTPDTMGRIIQALGRAGDVDKVRKVYDIAQNALRFEPALKFWPADSWSKIEDSMVIALAHAGDIDAAHVYRKSLLENGSAPSADAYGALIQYTKDTTDDTSNALSLFQEAERQNVRPNQYLYNNIISKLAKARKAEYALDLFERMKEHNIFPSSITYGAVIGACVRVGDVQRAETLFAEMEAAQNFKPRVPPYNHMMQLYTTTKPRREKALLYYGKMTQARVAPTAHTYKLLMDTYGTLEPVDIENMEKVFVSLQRNKSIPIQGTHFASLINAYGCVVKDLERAIAIFDSIPSYPRAQPADAVVYEAMINVLVVHKKPELIQGYVDKMKEQGVRMTAYIANFLIKGYANARELDQARAIFEGLADPPEGVAAPGNHFPHDAPPIQGQDTTGPAELVYREPSTWEAMIRAELGAGEKARALELLERLKARKYPDAVYNRISGILIDHSAF